MRLVFYIFIFAQFSNFLSVFAEKIKNDSSKFNSIKWEKIRENEVKPLKKIIWKSYQEDESYFKNKDLEQNSEKNRDENTEENTDNYFFNNQKEKKIFINEQKTTKELLDIQPLWRNRILRVSFEEIDMPDESEQMGLYGIGAYERFNPWLYGGITAYGAATGRRGGFFTGGYTLGMQSKLTDNWILDVGGYAGAGGGGAAPDGGG